MKQKWTVVVMMVVLSLLGCRDGERATVTGGYGAAVVTGEVVMATAGSPQGVEVSVRGTGQAMILGGDGRFAFSGIPADAQLDFRRATDGIEASLRLESASGHVVVELAQTEARKSSSRRRGVGGGTKTVLQFEGLIRSASASEIVVYTSKKEEVTIALTAETVIRKGGTPLTPADLLVDTRVHVKAQQVDTGFSAVLVIVQNETDDDDDGGEEAGPVVREYEGLVLSSAIDRLVIFDSHKQEVAFVLTVDTVIRKGNRQVLATEIQPGWRVHVKAAAGTDGNKTALRVTIQNTNGGGDDGSGSSEVKLNGRVTAVGATDLTVETDAGLFTVQTDAATRIEKKKQAITLAQIAAGDRVKVEGTKVSETTVLAKEIEVK